MTAYAIAHLRSVDFGPEIVRYLEEIDDTFTPYGGRFVVHGAEPEVHEGPWPGHVVVVEFPDLEQARAWYRSPAYQAILPLRTEHSDSSAILVDGVPPGYRASDYLAKVGRG
ncbi:MULTISPECIES: DUF1330 domain-containing protein [Rhodococcus]|uniref:DUF1330 domain-containing protein n=1 Tax=Rhodococcus TaxID=1827 RepID=UPI0002D23E9F|nr:MULTISPECIES: DUF1330 domain-containing protein [Rhodococcus]MBC2590999.1 DUF1330 domain-containing protein [Rhodococcus aetherivorans]OLL18137.1 hypothetical protein BKE56_016415 [Rhodococcus sp. M8]QIX49666.1 DUF1330 domain-containing protein [Rhodococcus sp. DMU1]QPG45182.1 DUF1330 domain-containing protein [Rhodococcus sp. M8]CCW10753.1 hypothetical protein EBESD8_12840 [Rhodococcus aetherivorans]